MTYQITNIKVSLKTQRICLDTVQRTLTEKKIIHKNHGNFLVVRKKFTYIIFKEGKRNNNHVNITKIQNFNDVICAQEELKDICSYIVIIENTLKVDNITASLDIEKTINLVSTATTLTSISKISYNTEKFPGLFAKFSIGTIILFHTGKCILIGAKTIQDLECLVSKLVHI